MQRCEYYAVWAVYKCSYCRSIVIYSDLVVFIFSAERQRDMLKQILSQIANQTYIIKDNQKRPLIFPASLCHRFGQLALVYRVVLLVTSDTLTGHAPPQRSTCQNATSARGLWWPSTRRKEARGLTAWLISEAINVFINNKVTLNSSVSVLYLSPGHRTRWHYEDWISPNNIAQNHDTAIIEFYAYNEWASM